MDFLDSIKEWNGEKYFTRHMKPVGCEPKFLVYICHGYGDHISLYDEIYDSLSRIGGYVFGNDHYGHGKSSGHRVWVPTYDIFTDACKAFIEEVKLSYPGVKLFIYGHSMGGLVSVRLVQLYPELADGLILEDPFLGVPDYFPKWLISTVVALGNFWLTQSLPVGSATSEDVCHDKDVVNFYTNDPLSYNGYVTAKFAASSFEALEKAMENAGNIKIPFLLCHGDSDKICPISACHLLFEAVPSTDKVFDIYEEGYHILRKETHLDIGTRFLASLSRWISDRC